MEICVCRNYSQELKFYGLFLYESPPSIFFLKQFASNKPIANQFYGHGLSDTKTINIQHKVNIDFKLFIFV